MVQSKITAVYCARCRLRVHVGSDGLCHHCRTAETLETAVAGGLLDRLGEVAHLYGCSVEYWPGYHGQGFALRAGDASWHLGADPATAEEELRALLEKNPQVAHHATPRGGAWCAGCGGPVADGGTDCGECR